MLLGERRRCQLKASHGCRRRLATLFARMERAPWTQAAIRLTDCGQVRSATAVVTVSDERESNTKKVSKSPHGGHVEGPQGTYAMASSAA